jgi:hypothetical protein
VCGSEPDGLIWQPVGNQLWHQLQYKWTNVIGLRRTCAFTQVFGQSGDERAVIVNRAHKVHFI